MCISFERCGNHWASQVVGANFMYSSSNEDLKTITGFLLLHEINDEPRENHISVVNLLVTWYASQSESQMNLTT